MPRAMSQPGQYGPSPSAGAPPKARTSPSPSSAYPDEPSARRATPRPVLVAPNPYTPAATSTTEPCTPSRPTPMPRATSNPGRDRPDGAGGAAPKGWTFPQPSST